MNNDGPARQRAKTDVRGSETVVKLCPDIKAKIGQRLRLMYSEVVDQGMPDRFAEMLRRLDESVDEDKKK